MTTYEYKIVYYEFMKAQERELYWNTLGAEGWKLTCVLTTGAVVFMREKPITVSMPPPG